MKYSIRFKMSLWVVVSIVLVSSVAILFANFFMEDYYIDTKVQATIDVYEELSETIKQDKTLKDSTNHLNSFCETKGVSCIVMESNLEQLYSYGSIEVLDKRMLDILFDLILKEKEFEEELISKTDNYTIRMISQNENKSNKRNNIIPPNNTDNENIKDSPKESDKNKHIEMTGTLTDDVYFVVRVAVGNIQESIGITTRILLVLCFTLVIVITIIMLLITRNYTKPLLRIAETSKKMAKLDFDVRCDEDRKDEIGTLATSINEMSRELESTISNLKTANLELEKDISKKEKIDKMRTEFIANVSHELKTPIALIQGYTEGLKEGIVEEPEEREYYCDVIMDEVKKMNHMVKNLLTLNQIEFEDEQIKMERFNLTELVEGILNVYKLRAQQNGIKVVFDNSKNYSVWADEYRVEEMLINYITNAFNHVKGNNVIKVQILEKDGIVRVSVFNTGDSIPENELEHIWDKFYKVDKARTREYGGNGIGLSIVKAIANSMDKECGVINYKDGVEFWFELDSNPTSK